MSEQEKAAEDIFPEKETKCVPSYDLPGAGDRRMLRKIFEPSKAPRGVLDLDNLHANVEVMLNNFHEQFDSFHKHLEEVFKSHGSSLLNSVSSATASPATRATRNDKEYIIEIALPWVKKEDIKVSVSEDKLIVEAKSEVREQAELTQGVSLEKIYREFPLENVVVEEASSTLKDGVLKVVVPIQKEREEPKARQLEIE